MPSTLQHYWHLASASTEERLSSTKSLIVELKQHQEAGHISDGPISEPIADDRLDEGDADQVFAKKVAEAERALDRYNSGEVTYAMRRLMKGLASHRDSSRLGFSVALCELIGQLGTVSAQDLTVLVEAYSSPATKVKGQEERDLLFAHLFGLYAILQSGVLFNEKLSTKEDYKLLIESVWHLGKSKTWLRESAGSIIVEAVNQLAKSEVNWKDELPSWLAEKVCDAKEIGPESIAILLVLQKAFPSVVKVMPKIPLLASNTILASSNLAILAKILKEGADVDDAEKTGGETKKGAGPGHTKAHFVWRLILQDYSQKEPRSVPEQSSFSEMYRVLVDEGLFASTASDQKKYWGFQIFEMAVQMIDIDNLAAIFTKNFMRTWMNHLAAKDRILHKAAQHCVTMMLSVVKIKPNCGHIIIQQLLRQDSAPFDAVTSTKTVEAILTAMASKDAVKDYIQYLILTTCQPAREDAHKSRRWALDQLMSVVRNGSLPSSEDSVINVLRFFAGHGFFNMLTKGAESSEVDTSSEFSVTASPPFTPDIKNICRIRFFSCLGDLNDRRATCHATEGESRRSQGIMEDGNSWVSAAFDVVSNLEEDHTNFKSLHSPGHQDEKAASKLRKKLMKSRQKSKDEAMSRKLQDFETMLLSGLLFTRTMDIEASTTLLTPLLECGERMVSDKSSEDGKTTIELLVPCVVSFLELPSAFLRSIATQAFASFSNEIDEATLEQLLSHLGFSEEEEEETRDGSSVDSEAEDEYSDEEDLSDSISVTSASSVSLGRDETVDPILVAKLQEVLQAGGVADDISKQSDSDEDSSEAEEARSDFDDDQMMQIDDKLAEIFKQRLGARKEEDSAKREAVTLHIKILDLLDTFAKRHSNSPLCINLILPLFTIVMEKDAALGQLKQRASTILQKTICKSKDGLHRCLDENILIKPMEAVHRIATTQLSPAMSNLCSSVNVYLTKACKEDHLKAGKVRHLYISTLNDFIVRSSNNLRPQFLIEAFQKVPLLGFEMRNELLSAATGPQESAKKAYRRVQALEMLRATIVSLSNSSEKQQDLISFLPVVSKAILELVSTQKLRLKEILKIALDLARLTKKMPLDQSQRDKIWSADDIEKCIALIGSDGHLTNNGSIENLLRQLLAIVKSEDKKKRERSNEKEIQVKKRKE